jgi:hypothetical protein
MAVCQGRATELRVKDDVGGIEPEMFFDQVMVGNERVVDWEKDNIFNQKLPLFRCLPRFFHSHCSLPQRRVYCWCQGLEASQAS